MDNRNIEREVVAREDNLRAFQAHGVLVEAIHGAELSTRAIALYVELKAKGRASSLQCPKPDAIDWRRFSRRHEGIAGEVQGHRTSLIPCSGERSAIVCHCSL